MSPHGKFLLENCYVGYEGKLYVNSFLFHVDRHYARLLGIYVV